VDWSVDNLGIKRKRPTFPFVKMRVFIAIETGKEAKEKILEIQKQFSSFPLAFAKKEHLHLTLVFLGEVQEEKITEVVQVVESATKKTPPFDLEFSSLGAFPNLKLPKVVWVGLGGSLEILSNLEEKLKATLAQEGFLLEEEKFVPHITLGRIKSYTNKQIRRRLGEAIQRFGRIEPVKIACNAISIFKSTPTSAGYVHALLEKINLKKHDENIGY